MIKKQPVTGKQQANRNKSLLIHEGLDALTGHRLNSLYLSLGTNTGNKLQNLNTAIRLIAEKIGPVISQSSILETEPWGFKSPNLFFNMVILVETSYSPLEVLLLTQEIEKMMGRKKKSCHFYQDRLIDIDLILFENIILETDQLTLPHPLFHKRKFVLEPLCEIAPDLIHPTLNKTIKELLKTQKTE